MGEIAVRIPLLPASSLSGPALRDLARRLAARRLIVELLAIHRAPDVGETLDPGHSRIGFLGHGGTPVPIGRATADSRYRTGCRTSQREPRRSNVVPDGCVEGG